MEKQKQKQPPKEIVEQSEAGEAVKFFSQIWTG